ncbi:glycosyl transferase [Candidatus Nomurabacteria bacterium CG2_30_43_9]|uniref:Glycosyl transferase n=1 Tax=Candidatus Nomurabacteria bacterium CG2_30_43_9 TaxID=1805283 RepID=A0A1J5GAQ3_9BACT|nr:MAG: glycosyl transferase [Candidatus Nomurabacteria bacterium CG2_30_43_9]
MSKLKTKSLEILGTRGVPAAHGGFETFAEHFALHLVKEGWSVTVYCQEKGRGEIYESQWNGVNRVHIPVEKEGAFGTVTFDWLSTRHAAKSPSLKLVLGYNTAIFNVLFRLKGIPHLINMDGLEWKRDKWNVAEKAWLWTNERLGCWFGNHLIADHPQIAKHLETRVNADKITMIPYGSHLVADACVEPIKIMGLKSGGYSVVIARPEPENSIFEIVKAFSAKSRGHKLVVLGSFDPDKNKYHADVLSSASEEVLFPGAIYDSNTLKSLRFYCRLYIHGHTVGGTNPSLVEALGAGSAVLAHDNRFNRWVAGDGAAFFSTEDDCATKLQNLLSDDKTISMMKSFSAERYKSLFTWESVLEDYTTLSERWLP